MAAVANHHQQATFARWQNLEKVASNLSRRLVDALHLETRNRLDLLRQDDLLDFARRRQLTLQQRLLAAHLRMDAGMAPAFLDEDHHKSRVTQAHGNNRGDAIECEPALHPAHRCGIHLSGLGRAGKQVAEHAHNQKLKDKQRNSRFPYLAPQRYSGHRIGDRKKAREHDRQRKAQLRLVAHLDDVVGKRQDSEGQEHGQQKNGGGRSRRISPDAYGFLGIRNFLFVFQIGTELQRTGCSRC
jgi:hypothetical protein